MRRPVLWSSVEYKRSLLVRGSGRDREGKKALGIILSLGSEQGAAGSGPQVQAMEQHEPKYMIMLLIKPGSFALRLSLWLRLQKCLVKSLTGMRQIWYLA